MSHPTTAFTGRRRRKSLEERLYDLLGGHDEFGDTRPPGDRLGIALNDDELARTSNDGFELWIGSASQWSWHCRAPEARRLAWFILWKWWAKGTWFGLRRAIWYRLLSRSIKRHERGLKQ